NLLSFRAVDYRYRFNRAFALNGFFGVSRYEFELPAYGYYYGAGLQYMNVLPSWDIALDVRNHDKLGRDKTLPTDPSPSIGQPRLFFDVNGISLYVSYHW
ncbi:MAG TPA: hypothetical protein VET48_08340, partial [Steroidobacteraceae bacterium]|nr:hypothetical protein [Steroidobacteraceae bacterium]